MIGAVALLMVLTVLVGAPARAEGPSPDKAKPGAKDGADVVARDYYFISNDLVRNKDGTVTWFYVTNHVGASQLKSSLDQMKIPGLTLTLRKRDLFQFRDVYF